MNEVSTQVSSGIVSLGYTTAQIDTIKETVAKGATNEELFMFLSLAKKYELDPFAKEIWFIKDKSGKVMIQAGRDGFLKTAQRDARFKGIASFPVYSNDEFEINPTAGEVKHKPNFKERGELIGAWARVEKEGITPYVSFADFKEYYAGYKDENGKIKTGQYGQMKPQIWDLKPSMMIQKVAQTIALRMTFGINGMYSPEEVGENNEEIVDIKVDRQKTTTSTRKASTPKTKTDEVPVDAIAAEVIEEITADQVTMIHALWGDITELKGWDPETSDQKYRENLATAAKVESSKDLSKAKASMYIEYLSKSLDKIAEQIDTVKNVVSEKPTKAMSPEEAEVFMNS